MNGYDEELNTDNIAYRYSEVALPGGERIHTCAKYAASANICECPDKYIKLSKVSMCVKLFSVNVLGFLFLIHKIMMTNKWALYLSILFTIKILALFYPHKQLLPDNGKTCPL